MNKAPGVDLVGTNMLVELADEICDTVADLFRDWLMLHPYLRNEKNQVCPIIDQLV